MGRLSNGATNEKTRNSIFDNYGMDGYVVNFFSDVVSRKEGQIDEKVMGERHINRYHQGERRFNSSGRPEFANIFDFLRAYTQMLQSRQPLPKRITILMHSTRGMPTIKLNGTFLGNELGDLYRTTLPTRYRRIVSDFKRALKANQERLVKAGTFVVLKSCFVSSTNADLLSDFLGVPLVYYKKPGVYFHGNGRLYEKEPKSSQDKANDLGTIFFQDSSKSRLFFSVSDPSTMYLKRLYNRLKGIDFRPLEVKLKRLEYLRDVQETLKSRLDQWIKLNKSKKKNEEEKLDYERKKKISESIDRWIGLIEDKIFKVKSKKRKLNERIRRYEFLRKLIKGDPKTEKELLRDIKNSFIKKKERGTSLLDSPDKLDPTQSNRQKQIERTTGLGPKARDMDPKNNDSSRFDLVHLRGRERTKSDVSEVGDPDSFKKDSFFGKKKKKNYPQSLSFEADQNDNPDNVSRSKKHHHGAANQEKTKMNDGHHGPDTTSSTSSSDDRDPCSGYPMASSLSQEEIESGATSYEDCQQEQEQLAAMMASSVINPFAMLWSWILSLFGESQTKSKDSKSKGPKSEGSVKPDNFTLGNEGDGDYIFNWDVVYGKSEWSPRPSYMGIDYEQASLDTEAEKEKALQAILSKEDEIKQHQEEGGGTQAQEMSFEGLFGSTLAPRIRTSPYVNDDTSGVDADEAQRMIDELLSSSDTISYYGPDGRPRVKERPLTMDDMPDVIGPRARPGELNKTGRKGSSHSASGQKLASSSAQSIAKVQSSSIEKPSNPDT